MSERRCCVPAPAVGAARGRGFTLLELMVALALAGLLLAIAQVRPGGAAARSVHDEFERVRALIALGSEQAILHGDDLGIGFAAHGYRFFQRVQDSWRPLRVPRAYRDHRLAPGVRLQLHVEGTPIALPASVPRPQVVLWSSGELTAFELVVRRDEQQRRLIAAADGSLRSHAGAHTARAE